jgi:hypothetical protein
MLRRLDSRSFNISQMEENIMNKMAIMVMLGVSAILAEQVPVEVQKVIDSAISGNDAAMSSFNENAKGIGLDSGIKLSDLKAGEAIHLYWFIADSLDKLTEKAPITSVIKPLNEWMVPLMFQRKAKALLVVVKIPNSTNWQVGGYGHVGIAKRWEKICQIWPESKGYHPIFIGSLFGPSYFYIPEKGDKNLTPFTPDSHHTESIESYYSILDSSNHVLKGIRSRIRLPQNEKEGTK